MVQKNQEKYQQPLLDFRMEGDLIEPETIPVLDRLQICQQTEGFLPTSRGELNEAFGLQAFVAETRAGAAKHLAEVATRQKRYGVEDTQRAGIHKTRNYLAYAQRARLDGTMLTTLQEELREASGNRFSSIDSIAVTGRGQLTRFIDLRDLAKSRDFSQFPFAPLRPYSVDMPETFDPYVAVQADSHITERISGVLTNTRLWEGRRDVAAAITDQKARHSFWVERLKEIEQYQTGGIRAVAHNALRQVGATVAEHV